MTGDVQQLLDRLHLLLSGLQSTLDESLLGGHTSDVVVEDESSGEERERSVVDGGRGLVDDHVERSTVILVPCHLDILKIIHKVTSILGYNHVKIVCIILL